MKAICSASRPLRFRWPRKLRTHRLRHARATARLVVERHLAGPLAAPVLLNVNIPNRRFDDLHGFAVTAAGQAASTCSSVVRTTTPYGDTVYWIGPVGLACRRHPAPDFHAVEQGIVSVTPLRLDLRSTANWMKSALEQIAMRKRVSQPDVYPRPCHARPSPVRYDSGRLGPGITATNSNTRISAPTLQRPAQAPVPRRRQQPGLELDRLRQSHEVQRLRGQGISDERVLNAMSAVPRHLFVDEALASRCYEDAALPTGHSQNHLGNRGS